MLEALRERFGEAIEAAEEVGRELRLRVAAAALVSVCQYCKQHGFNYLIDITAVDTGSEPATSPAGKLRVVYRLGSLSQGSQVVIGVEVPRSGGRAPSVCGVYRGAEWAEREVYDMFGVRFDGHPDLTRILLTDDWKGHPLLKQGAS